jgi:site-specific DNA-cytosine methylase
MKFKNKKTGEIKEFDAIMINASLVSAQNRKRLFWTNIPNVTLPEDRGVLLKDILEPQVDEGFYIKDKSNTVRSSGLGSKFGDKHCWDSIRIGQFNKGGQGDRIYSTDGKSINLSANGGGGGAKTGLYLVAPNGKEIILGNEELQVLKEGRTELGKKSRQEIRKLTGKDSTFRSKDHKAYFGREGIKANCITTGLGVEGMIAIIPEATKKGYAVAHEGQSIDLSFPTSKTRRGRVGGKLIIANNYNKRVFNDKCGTIGTSMGRTAKQGIAIYKNEISKDSFIRKLTPIECARLQCFPDNWCSFGIDKNQYCGNINICKQTVKLKTVIDKLLTENSVSVLCIIKDIKGKEALNQENTQKNTKINVNFAITKLENMEQKECVINTIKCGKNMKTLCFQINKEKKLKKHLQIMDMSEENMATSNIERLWKISWEGNLPKEKQSIILMAIKQITELIISTYAKVTNINLSIDNLKELPMNSSEITLSNLEMENIISISNTQQYKCYGNAVNVEVVKHILSQLKKTP